MPSSRWHVQPYFLATRCHFARRFLIHGLNGLRVALTGFDVGVKRQKALFSALMLVSHRRFKRCSAKDLWRLSRWKIDLTQEMMENPFAKEPKATSAWLWQVFTGIALVLLLGLHFIANHFIVKGGLRDFADVVSYLRNPIILVLEVLFLVVVATHAMLGVRAIVMDFGLSRSCRKAAEPGAHYNRSADRRLWPVADMGHHPLKPI